jgi:hypothetical protein
MMAVVKKPKHVAIYCKQMVFKIRQQLYQAQKVILHVGSYQQTQGDA